jgi:hypothetical protein
MILRRHPARRLAAYHDRELSTAESQAVGVHLEGCASCRAELEQIRFNASALSRLPLAAAPDAIWEAIERAADAGGAIQSPIHDHSRRLIWRAAFAVVAAGVVVTGLATWLAWRPAGLQWDVERVAGRPTAGSRGIDQAARVPAGSFLETDGASRARIRVGPIGEVEVGPSSRVRLASARPGEYRLMLARGEIRATISAPPRFFFVDTPSATAVDLGCAYTMQVDATGAGVLHVTSGWVALEWEAKESLVPAGAMCTTRPGAGPSIPYFEDAGEAFQRALAAFESAGAAGSSLDAVLTEARVRDTLTLWHLISRVPEVDRLRVFDRITALTPLPAGLTREKALQLDPPTLKRWREELAWTW